jgi:hypothetical protein
MDNWKRIGDLTAPLVARVLPKCKAEVVASIASVEELEGYTRHLEVQGRAREPGEAAALAHVARRLVR